MPSHSPELQPAERLRPLTNEAVANQLFQTLDDLEEVLLRALPCLTEAARLDSGPDLLSLVALSGSVNYGESIGFDMIRERTKAGLEAARGRGRIGGRRPKLTRQQQETIIEMVNSEQKSSSEAALLFNVHPSTIFRLLAKHRHSEIL